MDGKSKFAIFREQDVDKMRQFRLFVVIVWLGLFLVHANKALGFYPLVADEYWYTSDIRHRPWSDTLFPGYLYYLVYWSTDFFKYRFLDAGRVLNAFFFVLSGPFIYRISRLACGRNLALFIAFLTLVSPFSTYTILFMPESLYFTLFWGLAWLTIDKPPASPFRAGVMFGAGVAILSLVKMHGVFLLFGYVLYALASAPRNDRKIYFRIVGSILGGLIGSFLVVRLGIGFAFAGVNGLDPIGTSYRGFVDSGVERASLSLMVGGILKSLFGHLASISLYAGLPIALGVGYLLGDRRGGQDDRVRRIIIFAFCFLLPLLAITAGFASMLTATLDVYETTSINWRYYSFLFPVFPIIAAGILTGTCGVKPKPGLLRLILFAVPTLLSLYLIVTEFSGYMIRPIGSNPEFATWEMFPVLFWPGSSLLLTVLVAGYFAPRFAAKSYLYAILPITYILATISTYLLIAFTASPPDIFDKGGIFARDYLGERCSELTVIDGFYDDMHKALIHIDNPETDMLPQFTRIIDMTKVKPGKKWLLVFGGFQIPPENVKSIIEYVDPADTPEVLAGLQGGDRFRLMRRYALVELK